MFSKNHSWHEFKSIFTFLNLFYLSPGKGELLFSTGPLGTRFKSYSFIGSDKLRVNTVFRILFRSRK